MVVLGLQRIDAFVRKHAECRQEAAELVRDLRSASLRTPHEVLRRYPSAKVLDGRIVVFKVKGNRYRISCRFAYNSQTVVVLAAETHAEYDRRVLR